MNDKVQKACTAPGDDFEHKFQELEQLIESLQAGDLPLRDALQRYERGQQLEKSCMRQLQDAQARAADLQKQEPDTATPAVSTDKFEAEMQALEKLVERLEQADLPLADGLAALQEGLARGRILQRSLDKAEQSVQQLTRGENSETLTAFTDKDATSPGTD